MAASRSPAAASPSTTWTCSARRRPASSRRWENNLGVGLDTQLDAELAAEGLARELVNRIQNLRKTAGLEVSDRIELGVQGTDEVEAAVAGHRDYVSGETLAVALRIGSLPDDPAQSQALTVNGLAATVALRKAER